MRIGLAFSLCACLAAHAQEAAPEPAAPGTLLNPSSFTITGHLQTPGPLFTRELALRHIAEQIERKRAEEAARSPLEPFWKASFWQSPLWAFIPLPTRHLRITDDDPFFTPAYMTVTSRQDDYEMKRAEKAGQSIFER